MSARHRWSDPYRTEHETNRSCIKCGLIRVTRHEPGHLPWSEWWRDGLKVEATATPACEAATVAA